MNLKKTIYQTLTGGKVKKIVRLVENFCSENFPEFHQKFLLPAKFKAKSKLIKLTMTAKKNKSGIILWRKPGRKSKNFSPLVSVIVPNFNHEKYLRQRLDTIFSQTYKNFEVILLDDASTDDSLKILREFAATHKNTRVIANEKNSGNVFNQWRKGLDASNGDLIWVAESDDYSAENFLAKLVPNFADDAVKLAFVRSDFIRDGKKISDTDQYLADINSFDWRENFTVTAADFTANALAIKNVIPNVSGVLFRKPSILREEFLEIWQDMKLCGDWLFYLEIIKGGCVAYSPNATNFYRMHAQSTSLKIQKEIRYYEEHERIAKFIAANYNVPAAVHTRHLKLLEEHFVGYFGGKDKAEVAKYFRVEEILQVARRQNILMCIYSMSIGGGETFPLILANELYRRGYPVTVLDFQFAEDLPGVRKKLCADIPLVRFKEIGLLDELVAQFKIDITHTHHAYIDEIMARVPQPAKIITFHGMYEAGPTPDCLKDVLHLINRTTKAFVYIADKNLIPFKAVNIPIDGRFHKIGNGLETFPINPVPRTNLNIPEDSFVACVVSRALPQKGWQPAINAVELANKISSRRIDLILVGAGEMYDKLKGTDSEFVHFTGFQSNVRDYLAAADIGLLPSEYTGESFPLLIIDSFFSGRPVVSSNLGEVANMLKDSDGEMAGVIFDLLDGKVPVEKLSEILIRLANDAAEYEKISARVAGAAEKFSISKVAEKYIEVYNAITK